MPVQYITGGAEDNSKRQKIQFHTENEFNFEEDISLKPTGIQSTDT